MSHICDPALPNHNWKECPCDACDLRRTSEPFSEWWPASPPVKPEPPRTDADLLELAWLVIANAGGGDWSTQTPEWQEAATRWRDDWMQGLPRPSLTARLPELRTSEPSEGPVARLAKLLSEAGAEPIISLTPAQWSELLAIKVRAAKVEALREVAKAGCRHCAALDAAPLENKAAAVHAARWLHPFNKFISFCERPEVWDALQALQEGRQ